MSQRVRWLVSGDVTCTVESRQAMESAFQEHADILNCRYASTGPRGSLTCKCAVRVWLPEEISIPPVLEEAMSEGELNQWTMSLGMTAYERGEMRLEEIAQECRVTLLNVECWNYEQDASDEEDEC